MDSECMAKRQNFQAPPAYQNFQPRSSGPSAGPRFFYNSQYNNTNSSFRPAFQNNTNQNRFHANYNARFQHSQPMRQNFTPATQAQGQPWHNHSQNQTYRAGSVSFQGPHWQAGQPQTAQSQPWTNAQPASGASNNQHGQNQFQAPASATPMTIATQPQNSQTC